VIGGVHDRIGGYKGDCGGMRCGIAVAIPGSLTVAMQICRRTKVHTKRNIYRSLTGSLIPPFTVLRLGLAVTATRAPVIGGVHDRIGGYKGDCGGMWLCRSADARRCIRREIYIVA
jgi:hypothetical protein